MFLVEAAAAFLVLLIFTSKLLNYAWRDDGKFGTANYDDEKSFFQFFSVSSSQISGGFL
jgi:hypothetical protein